MAEKSWVSLGLFHPYRAFSCFFKGESIGNLKKRLPKFGKSDMAGWNIHHESRRISH